MNRKSKLVTHLLYPPHPVMERFTSDGGFITGSFWKQNLWLLKHMKFNRIFCVNKYLKEFIKQFVNDNIVQHIPYPVDIERFRPAKDKDSARKELGLPLDKLIIGYLGQVYLKRGIFTLLNAFDIAAKSNRNMSLVVASYGLHLNKPYVRYFFDYLNQLKANKQIMVLNRAIKRVELFYQAVDIMVLPFTQPYYVIDPPLVLMESLASGVPIITTPVGAIKEIIFDGLNALHVPPRNSIALSEAITRLASDQELRSRLGEEARKTSVEYSFETVGTLLTKSYEDMFA